jgi:hypothetical protein
MYFRVTLYCRVLDYIVIISFRYIMYCVCFNLTVVVLTCFIMCMCVRAGFVMCRCVYVWGFVMCVCVYVWVL